MDSLLTNGEMEEFSHYWDLGRICKAQDLKTKWEMVKWFDKRWRSYVENPIEGLSRMTFAISEEEWEALRREVGLE